MGNEFINHPLSKFRTELMGVATLLILICHIHLVVGDTPFTLFLYKWSVSQGVEMFLFLSGIGLSFSLEMNKDKESLSSWYKRRFLRVLIPYMLIATPWYVARGIINVDSVCEILYVLSTIAYWTESQGAWFIALILPLYLLAPILHKLINGRKGSLMTFLSVLGMILYSAFYDNHALSVVCKSYGFILGMYSYRFLKSKTNINLCILVTVVIALLILMPMFSDKIRSAWTAMFLYMPMACYLFERSDISRKILASLGKISLESYLINVTLISLFSKFTQFKNWGVFVNCCNWLIFAKIVNVLSALIINNQRK